MSYRLRPKAETDIAAIADYIARDNITAAENWVIELFETFRLLGQKSGLGRPRDDIFPGIRTLPRGSYLIIFRQQDYGVLIIRVVHASRDWVKFVR